MGPEYETETMLDTERASLKRRFICVLAIQLVRFSYKQGQKFIRFENCRETWHHNGLAVGDDEGGADCSRLIDNAPGHATWGSVNHGNNNDSGCRLMGDRPYIVKLGVADVCFVPKIVAPDVQSKPLYQHNGQKRTSPP
jgi:hypothetical protein